MHVVHAAEIDPMRVVFGEHDRFLGGLEEELEAVAHVRWMAAHPLACLRDESLALRCLCRQFPVEIPVGLTHVVPQGLDDRRRIFDPAGEAPAPTVTALAPYLEVLVQQIQESSSFGRRGQCHSDAIGRFLLQRSRGRIPPEAPVG